MTAPAARVATRYGRRSRPALQEVQQRIAELTADVFVKARALGTRAWEIAAQAD
jgi:hypothetical protein